MGGRDPLFEFLKQVDGMFRNLMDGLDDEIGRRMEEARIEWDEVLGSARLPGLSDDE